MELKNSNSTNDNDMNNAPVSDTVKREKIKKWLVRVNVVAVSVLFCLLILMIYDKTHNRKISGEDVPSGDTTVEKKIDDSMSSLYQSMLSGWTYKLDKNTVFSFGRDNSFSGFFDKDHKDVKKYSYEISLDEKSGSHMLNIYNEDKSGMVTYEISMDADGNILLTYPGAEKSFVLETDKAEVLTD